MKPVRVYIKARYLGGYVHAHYNYYLQSFFYKALPPKVRKSLHDMGVEEGPRRFKMFTFSRIYGDFTRDEGRLLYRDFVYFAFSSALDTVVKYLYEYLNSNPEFVIDKAKFVVDKVLVKNFDKELASKGLFYTLSPVVVTKRTAEGSKYLFPHQLEYDYLIKLNMKRKVLALTGKVFKTDLEVRVENWRRSVTKYKRTRVEGVMGKFKLTGTLTVLKVAYEAGLGVKNSQGFGMLEFEGTSLRDLLGE
jgi:CRISPR-associated endoribonuclease Cas6